MSVVAIAPYEFTPRDVRENFPAPLLYIGWEDHLMFCVPGPGSGKAELGKKKILCGDWSTVQSAEFSHGA